MFFKPGWNWVLILLELLITHFLYTPYYLFFHINYNNYKIARKTFHAILYKIFLWNLNLHCLVLILQKKNTGESKFGWPFFWSKAFLLLVDNYANPHERINQKARKKPENMKKKIILFYFIYVLFQLFYLTVILEQLKTNIGSNSELVINKII